MRNHPRKDHIFCKSQTLPLPVTNVTCLILISPRQRPPFLTGHLSHVPKSGLSKGVLVYRYICFWISSPNNEFAVRGHSTQYHIHQRTMHSTLHIIIILLHMHEKVQLCHVLYLISVCTICNDCSPVLPASRVFLVRGQPLP